jgi:O-succinylbenzoic acid--CoA ligase
MMVVRAITLGLNLTVIEPSKAPFKDLKEDYIFSACTPHQLENSINDLSRIKILLVGGAPISEKTRVSLNGSKNKIYETFGMTETVSHVALKNISKGEKSFKALDGIRFKSNNGCLKIYNTELLEAPITTSDIVDLQSEKEFVWKGRQDFIINSGGIKINPEVVEKTLSGFFSTPFIVLGLPDNTLGEKLIIAFEKETPSNYSKAIEALSSFEKPKMVFNFINFKRVNNKILRRGVLKTILSINESN